MPADSHVKCGSFMWVELWSGHVFSGSAESSTRCRFSYEMLLYFQTDEIEHDLILPEH